jgi:cell division transport system permease protein
MGLALALPLALELLVRNLHAATGDFSAAIGLSVYLKPQVSEQSARQLVAHLAARSDVASVELITATQALEELRTQSGLGAALDALSENPLPNVLTIRPTSAALDAARLQMLRSAVAAWPEVDSVQLDQDWVTRFSAILALMQRVAWITAGLLAVGVIAVVGNTIRLEVHSRAAQIEVTQLVGGSAAFVRRPFLYTGALYGLMAGLIAWGIVEGAQRALAPYVARLASAYGERFALSGPSIRELAALALVGIGLGWLGAAIASQREIARSAPGRG